MDNSYSEIGLINDIINQPQMALPIINECGLAVGDFTHSTCISIFKALADNGIITGGIVDIAKIADTLKGTGWGDIDRPELMANNRHEIEERVRDIKEGGNQRRLARDVQRIVADADMATAEKAARLADVAQKHQHSAILTMAPALTLAELHEPIPEADNPNALFSNGWLRKGGGVVLTAQAGVGKSIFTMQAAYAWSVGKPFFEITPLRPLKIGIIQFEDDADEMSQFRDSMRKGYRIKGWTDAELAQAERNIAWEFESFLGVAGDAFINRLRDVQRQRKYDLLIVNPLQSCFGADISKNAAVSHFFREGIDPIVKDAENGCAIMFVHHTNKPPRTEDGKPTRDTDTPYEGAGGAEIVNWERAALVLKATNAEGFFKLVAAKRGERLSWKDDEGGKTKSKVIAHSEGIMFWREPEPDEIPEGVLPVPKVKADSKADARALAEVCLKQARLATELRTMACSEFGRTRGRRALEELKLFPNNYKISVLTDNATRRTAYGTKEGCEMLLKYLRQKQEPLELATC